MKIKLLILCFILSLTNANGNAKFRWLLKNAVVVPEDMTVAEGNRLLGRILIPENVAREKIVHNINRIKQAYGKRGLGWIRKIFDDDFLKRRDFVYFYKQGDQPVEFLERKRHQQNDFFDFHDFEDYDLNDPIEVDYI